jgi:hypothetical protein
MLLPTSLKIYFCGQWKCCPHTYYCVTNGLRWANIYMKAITLYCKETTSLTFGAGSHQIARTSSTTYPPTFKLTKNQKNHWKDRLLNHWKEFSAHCLHPMAVANNAVANIKSFRLQRSWHRSNMAAISGALCKFFACALSNMAAANNLYAHLAGFSNPRIKYFQNCWKSHNSLVGKKRL